MLDWLPSLPTDDIGRSILLLAYLGAGRALHPSTLQTLSYFWVIVESYSPDERCRLLQFVTGAFHSPMMASTACRPLSSSYDSLSAHAFRRQHHSIQHCSRMIAGSFAFFSALLPSNVCWSFCNISARLPCNGCWFFIYLFRFAAFELHYLIFLLASTIHRP